ncbi:MAG: DEAD/DEAH box helicase family protein [Nitrospiria bacterium]
MQTANQIRGEIEALLQKAGWVIQGPETPPRPETPGVAVRDFPLARGYGTVDYLLCHMGKAVGLIEVVSEEAALKGVPVLSEKYTRGLPFSLRLFIRPLPFLYQSTGREICFTNGFDPAPAPRGLFGFHRPETLKQWIEDGMVGETPRDMAAEYFPEHRRRGRTFHERILINMPPSASAGFSDGQLRVITLLEQSFQENRRRVLVVMTDEAERTAAVIHFSGRILQFADARRVLFVAHSDEVGQNLTQWMQDTASRGGMASFAKACSVEYWTDASMDPATRFCVTTLADLRHRLRLTLEDVSATDEGSAHGLRYNPDFPIETFDVVIIDQCEKCLSDISQPILEYFDAYLIGLSAEPNEQIAHYFEQNVVTDNAIRSRGGDGLDVITAEE